MLGKFIAVSTFLSAAILIFLFQTTNPSTIGPGGILAVFFLLYLIFLGVFSWVIYSTSWLVAKLARPVTLKKSLEVISLKHAYYHASVIAIAPVIMVGMSSVGKLGVYEVTLVGVFVLIGEFYIQKRI